MRDPAAADRVASLTSNRCARRHDIAVEATPTPAAVSLLVAAQAARRQKVIRHELEAATPLERWLCEHVRPSQRGAARTG
jgi:hypothetical protein